MCVCEREREMRDVCVCERERNEGCVCFVCVSKSGSAAGNVFPFIYTMVSVVMSVGCVGGDWFMSLSLLLILLNVYLCALFRGMLSPTTPFPVRATWTPFTVHT